MNAAGLILPGGNALSDEAVFPEMTRRRNLAGIPFGCRYRFIDFSLSNMVNAGISHIGVVTDFSSQALLDHLGNGKDWDLARRAGGLRILPSYVPAAGNRIQPDGRLAGLFSALPFLRRSHAEYTVLSDCDVVCNPDVGELLARHVACGADVTFVGHLLADEERPFDVSSFLCETDAHGRLTAYARRTSADEERRLALLPIAVCRTDFLRQVLENALAHGYTDFDSQLLRPNLQRYRMQVYPFTGWCGTAHSLESYYRSSMALLDPAVRRELFGNAERPVLTRVHNTPPTRYLPGAKVVNSLIADGCTIAGTVENSLLFRGVRVGRGSTVRNSILFQNTFTGDGVSLHCVITDKDVTVRDGCVLSGHTTVPFYLDKGTLV